MDISVSASPMRKRIRSLDDLADLSEIESDPNCEAWTAKGNRKKARGKGAIKKKPTNKTNNKPSNPCVTMATDICVVCSSACSMNEKCVVTSAMIFITLAVPD